MEQIEVYKDLMEDFKEYFKTHRDLLPVDVILEKVDIIGNAVILPEYGKTKILNWEVIFRGDLGNPEWIEKYDIGFDGLSLAEVKKTISPLLD